MKGRSYTLATALVLSAHAAAAQQVVRKVPDKAFFEQHGKPVEIVEAAPGESVVPIKNAAFSAEAVTEFTQILGDGNRIERRYVSSVARDSRGRTRREEEI